MALEYCPHCGEELKSNSVPLEKVEEIIDYLNKKTSKKYRPRNQSTRRLINVRFNEGYNVEDFMRVIDNQCKVWLNDPRMCQYLRPQTLFSTKFESYLNNGHSYETGSPTSQYRKFERVMSL